MQFDYNPNIFKRIDELTQVYDSRKDYYLQYLNIFEQLSTIYKNFNQSLVNLQLKVKSISNNNQFNLHKNINNFFNQFLNTQISESNQLSLNIKQEIDSFTQELGQQKKEIQRFKDKKQKLFDDFVIVSKQVSEYYKNYKKISEKSKILNQSQDKIQQIKDKQKQIKNVLINNIQQYNQYISNYLIDYANINNSYKQFEISNSQNLRDTYFKFIVYKISFIQNIQFDINNSSVNIEKDLSYLDMEQIDELLKQRNSQKQRVLKKIVITNNSIGSINNLEHHEESVNDVINQCIQEMYVTQERKQLLVELASVQNIDEIISFVEQQRNQNNSNVVDTILDIIQKNFNQDNGQIDLLGFEANQDQQGIENECNLQEQKNVNIELI